MNLNISYNWLKEYLATKKSAHEFAKEISLCGPSVDKIFDFGGQLNGVLVGKILEISKHPNADKLSVGKIDIGGKIIQLVFGDKAEVKIGQQLPVAVAPTTLPTGQEILKSKLRGVESEGMLCLDSELGISQEDKITFFDESIKPGTSILTLMKFLNDQILDMEITSNRPDAMSIIGIAREGSAIMGDKFLYKEPKPNLKIHPVGTGRDLSAPKLNVSVKEPKLCSRYQAVVMTDVKIDSSPLWVQQRLLSAGLRPINNLVDITNYILLEFGQPMHVFDYDKLQGQEIIVRPAKKGEKILALDGKNYELNPENLVIADGKNPIAVAGVMGGELSAAHGDTKTIVFEAATFDPVSVRKTARVLNLHSDSSNLFEKGLNPQGTYPAMLRAIELAMELSGGKLASKIIDVENYKEAKKEIKLNIENVNKILGIELKNDQIKKILETLGFGVTENSKAMSVSVPWWREKDIEGEHDLIEEVARIYGYYKLPSKLMAGEIPSDSSSGEFFIEDKAKDILAGLGFAENYNYSFISEKLISSVGLRVEDHIKISNPLSQDFEYMRTSLVPGLLQAVAENESGFEKIKIFELSKIYEKHEGELAGEILNLGLVISGKNQESIYFELKSVLVGVLRKLNVSDFNFQLSKGEKYWQNQILDIKLGDSIVGQIGLINLKTLSALGIKMTVAAVEINFLSLIQFIKPSPTYKSLPKFPSIDLDLSIEIDRSVVYAEIISAISGLNALIKNISFLSEYHGEKVAGDKKAVAIRITYSAENKTLKLEEAQDIHNKVVDTLKKRYNIGVR